MSRRDTLVGLRRLLADAEGDAPAAAILSYAVAQLEAAPARYDTGAEFLAAIRAACPGLCASLNNLHPCPTCARLDCDEHDTPVAADPFLLTGLHTGPSTTYVVVCERCDRIVCVCDDPTGPT